MKRIVSVLLLLGVSTTLLLLVTNWKQGVPIVHAQSCSVASLTGGYGFTQTGFETKNTMGGNPLPFTQVGLATYDGAGNFSVTLTDQSPGKPTPYVPVQLAGSGTYTVNSDCTGVATITSGDGVGISVNFVLIGDGAEVFGINTTPNVVGTLDLKKQ
jgi:hypothetical protein